MPLHLRMVRFAILVCATAGVTVAQPVTRPEPCKVTIVVAPAEVREEIEDWVQAEPRCERELEVRVVPTDDGLYLQARDPSGRVRERVVPDSQSAAVLVVSWMADDSIAPTLPTAEDHAAVLQPPAIEMSDAELPVELHASAPRRHAATSLSVGALVASGRHVGMRGQLDLLAHHRWTLGVAGGWIPDRGGQARVVLGVAHSFGRLSLRAQLGLGVDVRAGDDRMAAYEPMQRDRVAPAAELGILASLRLGKTWGVIGGPLVDATREHAALSLFFGVRHGL